MLLLRLLCDCTLIYCCIDIVICRATIPKSARQASSSALPATSHVKVVIDATRETDATARLASVQLLSHHQYVHQSSSTGCQAFHLLGLAHICTVIATFKAAASTQGRQTSSQAINQQACRRRRRRRRCDRSIQDSSPTARSTEEEPRRASSRQCKSSSAERPGGRREQHTTRPQCTACAFSIKRGRGRGRNA